MLIHRFSMRQVVSGSRSRVVSREHRRANIAHPVTWFKRQTCGDSARSLRTLVKHASIRPPSTTVWPQRFLKTKWNGPKISTIVLEHPREHCLIQPRERVFLRLGPRRRETQATLKDKGLGSRWADGVMSWNSGEARAGESKLESVKGCAPSNHQDSLRF